MFYLISKYKTNTKVEIRLLYSLAKVNGKVNTKIKICTALASRRFPHACSSKFDLSLT